MNNLLLQDLRRVFGFTERLKKRPVLLYGVLILLGMAVAGFVVFKNRTLAADEFARIDDLYMNVRVGFFERALDAVRGRPNLPVLDHEVAYYYYLGTAGKWLGISTAWKMFLLVQITTAGAVLAVYPTLMYRLTRSLAVAMASPFLITVFLGEYLYTFKTSSYWAGAWIIVIALPLCVLLYKRKPDYKSLLMFIGLCLTAAAANVPRGHAALPVFIAMGVLAAIKFNKKLLCFLLVLVVMAGSYNLFTHTVPSVAYKNAGFEDNYFGPWHTLYIGLGFRPNKYGIEYSDDCAVQKAKETDPEIEYPLDKKEDHYFDILKTEYLTIAKTDPAFFLGTYARKFIKTIQDDIYLMRVTPYLGHLLLCALALLLFNRYRNMRLRRYAPWAKPFLLCCVICILFGMIPALIAVPGYVYMQGNLAACRLFAVGLGLAGVQGLVGYLKRLRNDGERVAAVCI
ncbi:MAG: hypothetical protein FWD16_07555 [Clostridia bacterium]|nr:hypothetical protein [Clostridia bacterium]